MQLIDQPDSKGANARSISWRGRPFV
jgi:hypothetical protein